VRAGDHGASAADGSLSRGWASALLVLVLIGLAALVYGLSKPQAAPAGHGSTSLSSPPTVSISTAPPPTVRSGPSSPTSRPQPYSSLTSHLGAEQTPTAATAPPTQSPATAAPATPSTVMLAYGDLSHPRTPPPGDRLPAGVPYAASSDPVKIQSVTLSSAVVHGGDDASGRVITTSNAAALTARIGTYQVGVPRLAPGIFQISIRVPRLPTLGSTVDIVLTAIRADGQTDQRTVPVRVTF